MNASFAIKPQKTFLPLRTHPLGEDVLCVSDGGRFFTAPGEFLARLSGGALLPSDLDFLCREGHAVREDDDLGRAAHAYNVAERLARAGPLDYLILVPTLRCNLSCSYCQVSRAGTAARGFDWSVETLAATLDLIDRLPTDRLKIEFQGGEPTLRPDLIRAVIDRCDRFEGVQFVICTNLHELGPQILDLFDLPNLYISTSLDGDSATHARQRTGGATDQFLANLRTIIDRYGPQKVSALPTVDPLGPPNCEALIDAYTEFGLNSIFLRPINYQGFARKRHKESREQGAAWRAYYERFVRAVILRNWTDRSRAGGDVFQHLPAARVSAGRRPACGPP